VLKHNTPILNLILDVVVVNINVFSALMVTLARCELDRGLVVTVELHGTNVGALVANLLQQAGEPGGFFGGVGKADIFGFSGWRSNELLLARAVAYSATSKLEEVARSGFTILSVCKWSIAVGVQTKACGFWVHVYVGGGVSCEAHDKVLGAVKIV
jgi:hypothetical protein